MKPTALRLALKASFTLGALGICFAACGTTPAVVGPPCDDPGKIQVRGMDTGFEFCTGGPVHRAHILSCPLPEPLPGKCDVSGGLPAECHSNAECETLGTGNVCASLGPMKPCSCQTSCTQDLECPGVAVCECGDPLSGCRQALCRSDADCTGGHLCIPSTLEHCGTHGFACTSDRDECQSDADCPGPMRPCIFRSDHRICEMPGCTF